MNSPIYQLEFLDNIIGCGANVGNMFDEITMGTKVVSGEDKINNSIYMILATRKGERLFLPTFGSDLYKDLFEQNDMIFEDSVIYHVTEALNEWMKCIDVLNVDVGVQVEKEGENIVPVNIYYRISGSNIEGNYVYPFNVTKRNEIQTYDMR